MESKELFEEINDTEGQASALNLIAVVYDDQGRNQDALKIYTEILNIVDKDNILRIAATYNNIGVMYDDMDDQYLSYSYHLKAFKTIENKGLPEDESQLSNNLGEIFIGTGHADSALYYINHGLKLALEINNLHRMANSYESLGNYYFWQKDYKLALSNYQKAFNLAEKIEIVYEISSTAGGLSKANAALGYFKEAYDFLSLQKIMEDSVKQKEIASYITQIELEKSFQKERDLHALVDAKN